MNFCSDNASGACPQVLKSILAANTGYSMPYGDDTLTQNVKEKINDLFEINGDIFFVSTGTAANALALSVITQPYGGIFCHPNAHILVDECGAPEFFTGGARLLPMDNLNGTSTPEGFEAAWMKQGNSVHNVQANVISITQATEAGTLYDLDTIKQLTKMAHDRGLIVHMDGARFANALVSLGCQPAEMSWKIGVDILSFGASKNGCIAAEAVIIFNDKISKNLQYHRKRSGHLYSKMRFISAQFDAYLNDNVWWENACHANKMMMKLFDGLRAIPNVEVLHEPQINMLFLRLSDPEIASLEADGFNFYRSADPSGNFCRFVTSYNTDPSHINSLLNSIRKYSNG